MKSNRADLPGFTRPRRVVRIIEIICWPSEIHRYNALLAEGTVSLGQTPKNKTKQAPLGCHLGPLGLYTCGSAQTSSTGRMWAVDLGSTVRQVAGFGCLGIAL